MKYLFKTIIRNFRRKPATNLINLLGLSVSLTLVIILSVYCYSELTTDSHQINGKRVYLYGLSEDRIYTPGILKDHIDLNIPGVESVVRMGGSWEAPVFQVENKEPITSDLIFADENFFKLFTYKVIEGNLESALKEPMKVVITKSLSDKLFGGKSALGKPVKLNNTQVLTVSAVIEEPKANSCISFSAITSMATRKIVQPEEGEFTQWNQCNFQTFILLKKGTSPDETTKTILSLFPEKDRDRFRSQELVPLKQIYFSEFSLYGSNYLVNGDKKKVMILVLVADSGINDCPDQFCQYFIFPVAGKNQTNRGYEGYWSIEVNYNPRYSCRVIPFLFCCTSDCFLFCLHSQSIYPKLYRDSLQSANNLFSGIHNHLPGNNNRVKCNIQYCSGFTYIILKSCRQSEKNSKTNQNQLLLQRLSGNNAVYNCDRAYCIYNTGTETGQIREQ